MAEKSEETLKRESMYRGRTISELKTLDVREFAKYLRARQRRTVLRNFQQIENFIKRAKKRMMKNKPVKTHLRQLVVVPEMVGMKIQIHNGHEFSPVDITTEMLGHVFGEFSITREKVKHGAAGIGASKGSKSQSKK